MVLGKRVVFRALRPFTNLGSRFLQEPCCSYTAGGCPYEGSSPACPDVGGGDSSNRLLGCPLLAGLCGASSRIRELLGLMMERTYVHFGVRMNGPCAKQDSGNEAEDRNHSALKHRASLKCLANPKDMDP